MLKRRAIVLAAMLVIATAGLAMAQATEPADAPPAAVVAVMPDKELTLLQLLLRGGPVMYPLVLCSILTVAFAIERAMGLRRHLVLPPHTLDRVGQICRTPTGTLDAAALQRELETHDDPLARVAAAGLRRAGRPLADIEKALEDAGAKEIGRLLRNNRVLSAVASLTPLLGLLGTVTGIIRSFMTVAAHEEALGRTELLAGGIYEALVATAAGLTVAISALVLYLYFQERVDRLALAIDEAVSPLAEKLASRA